MTTSRVAAFCRRTARGERGDVSPGGFDPASLREREQLLSQRLAAVLRRIGDATVVDRFARALTDGTAIELFALLTEEDRRVVTAAHECAMLRYSFIVAIVARAYGFDSYRRDDLVQRTFLDLPSAVMRARTGGTLIEHPEGWLRRRAYLVAREMLREEHGGPMRDRESGEVQRAPDGRVRRTRGTSVPLEVAESAVDPHNAPPLDALASEAERERLELALRALREEQPLWAEILRLHYFDGVRLDEVALRVGRAYGTVRNDAQKARARLEAIIRTAYPALAPDSDDNDRERADVVR